MGTSGASSNWGGAGMGAAGSGEEVALEVGVGGGSDATNDAVDDAVGDAGDDVRGWRIGL